MSIQLSLLIASARSEGKETPQSLLERLMGTGAAHAQGTALGPGSSEKGILFGSLAPPVEREHQHAIVVEKLSTAVAARKRAAELKTKLPGAMPVKAGDGYAVLTGVKPESAAVIEAVRLKRELGIDTELMRIK